VQTLCLSYHLMRKGSIGAAKEREEDGVATRLDTVMKNGHKSN